MRHVFLVLGAPLAVVGGNLSDNLIPWLLGYWGGVLITVSLSQKIVALFSDE